jgi:hypothetical protein
VDLEVARVVGVGVQTEVGMAALLLVSPMVA